MRDAAEWQQDADLSQLNTLRLPSRARWLATAQGEDHVAAVFARAKELDLPVFVLGAGSNVVLAPEIDGVVLRLAPANPPRIDASSAGSGALEVDLDAGSDWDGCVSSACAAGLWGIENLALIPGTVGAAPVQNIGAYGQELASRCVRVRAFDRTAGEMVGLDNAACEFGYRDSCFRRARDRWLITSVTLRLECQGEPVLDYPVLAHAARDVALESPAAVAELVRRVRRVRLPDPDELPNAGSFFKNPVVSRSRFESLRERFPECPGRAQGEAADQIRVPAAWLIERAGWRGRRSGALSISERHALVLVHHGGADGCALQLFAAQVRAAVAEKFDIELEQEPIELGW